MVSLAQTALFGIAGVILGNLATEGGAGGHLEGAPPRLGPDARARASRSSGRRRSASICGAVASRSAGIYFLMITLTYSVIATYIARPGDEDLRLLGDRRHQQLHAGLDRRHPRPPEPALLHRARGRDRRLRADPLHRPHAVRRSRCRASGTSRSGWRSLGYNVPLHRTLAFGFAAFLASLAGVLYVWWSGQVAPGNVDLPADDQPARHGGDRRPRPDRGRLARRLRLHRDAELHHATTRSRCSASAARCSAAASTRSSGSSSS